MSAKFVEYENGALEVKIGNTVEKFPNPDVSTACHVIGLIETIKQSKGLWEALIGEADEADALKDLHDYVKDCMDLHEQVFVQGIMLQFEVSNGVTLNVTDKNVLTLAHIFISEDDDEGQKRLKEYYINALKNA
jgi:hypothetical protein